MMSCLIVLLVLSLGLASGLIVAPAAPRSAGVQLAAGRSAGVRMQEDDPPPSPPPSSPSSLNSFSNKPTAPEKDPKAVIGSQIAFGLVAVGLVSGAFLEDDIENGIAGKPLLEFPDPGKEGRELK